MGKRGTHTESVQVRKGPDPSRKVFRTRLAQLRSLMGQPSVSTPAQAEVDPGP